MYEIVNNPKLIKVILELLNVAYFIIFDKKKIKIKNNTKKDFL